MIRIANIENMHGSVPPVVLGIQVAVLEARHWPCISQLSPPPQELFQRLDSWLLKAEGALSRSVATWQPRGGTVWGPGRGGLCPGWAWLDESMALPVVV